MAKGIFVSGTDTGVGKTRISALLVKALRSRGVDAVGMKPFCCGDREDVRLLLEASGGGAAESLVNPVWLQVPAAPYAASVIENRPVDTDLAFDAFGTLAKMHEFVVVEGVGGWRVPLTDQVCMSEFARRLALPVVVVTANRLGCINHTQLTVDAIRASGLECRGIILNEATPDDGTPARITNRAILEQILPVPVIAEVAYAQETLPDKVLDCVFRGRV